ncbi:MAG: hypothetical protein AB7W47_04000 [Calditrichaceae bacterium]
MIDKILTIIIDESKWLTASMSLAFFISVYLLYSSRFTNQRLKTRILAAMNMFFAVTIGMMAFGHILAVSAKLIVGTLLGSVVLFYVIGVVLALPSWFLAHHTWDRFMSRKGFNHKLIIFNTWLGITLLALGIHNLPLAIPAILNIGYYFHSRRITGWIIISLAIIVNLGLYIGSLVFLASGQSFEQFQGIQ